MAGRGRKGLNSTGQDKAKRERQCHWGANEDKLLPCPPPTRRHYPPLWYILLHTIHREVSNLNFASSFFHPEDHSFGPTFRLLPHHSFIM